MLEPKHINGKMSTH